jgi:Phage derived protein Gp49-like (DUF891)
MQWTIRFHEEFEPEFDELPAEVQDELYAEAGFVEKFGPETGRPHVDTLKGSGYPNMKELRFEAGGVNGALLLHSIQGVERFCSSLVIRPASVRRNFTNGSLQKLMQDTDGILRS